MLTNILDALRHWLYSDEFELEPGRFEGFLTPIADLGSIPSPADARAAARREP